ASDICSSSIIATAIFSSSFTNIFISRALAPAKPLKILVNEEEKMAVAIIEDEQMSLAIGRGGQNLRLASELTGYQIEPIRESEYQSEGEPPKSVSVEDIEELPVKLKNKLLEADVLDVSEIEELGRDGLLELPGVGPKSADKILEVIKAYSNKKDDEEASDETESN
ncbi:MAG TPA: hypothetical protein EYP36_03265, partial [Calditrichaeota bacterium]|nr:hypothetical protein [Calditrichota bacterium]